MTKKLDIDHSAKAIEGRKIWTIAWENAWLAAAKAAGGKTTRMEGRKAWTAEIIKARDSLPPQGNGDASWKSAWMNAWTAALDAAEVILEDASGKGWHETPPAAWAAQWNAAWKIAIAAAEAALAEQGNAFIPAAGRKSWENEWTASWKDAGEAGWAAALATAKKVLEDRNINYHLSAPVMSDTAGRAHRGALGRDAGRLAWRASYQIETDE